MENLQSVASQKIIIFIFAVLFILLQSVFLLKGTNYFLILPSIFLILTYKPKLLGYAACFSLGIINDIVSMQLVGVSSIVFVIMRYLKTIYVTRSHKDYVALLLEYLAYSLSLFILSYLLMLVLDLTSLSAMFFLNVFLLILGFFLCDFLWLKIFGLFNKK